MVEGRNPASTPVELSANTGVDTVFIQILGGGVSNFHVSSLEGLHARHKSEHLQHGGSVQVANISHGLELFKMGSVVHKVQHEIILHSDIKSLHFLGGVAQLGHSRVNSVLRLKELLVLGLDLVNNSSSVDGFSGRVEIDISNFSFDAGVVVEVKNGLQLTVRLTGISRGGGGTQSLQPVSGKLVG